MKKFLKIGAVFTALLLVSLCFVACGDNGGGATVLRVTLTGSDNGYKMYDYNRSYYTKGYIT